MKKNNMAFSFKHIRELSQIYIFYTGVAKLHYTSCLPTDKSCVFLLIKYVGRKAMEICMDRVDTAILACLTKNARMKASDIGKEINLSVSAVIERIKKMEANATIQKYTVVLNQKLMGNDLIALIEVSLEHPKYYDAFTEIVSNDKSIQECHYLTGEFDFMLKVLTDSSESLEEIHRKIKSLSGVQSTKTHFVLKTIKNEMSVIPDIK